jgi:hypothetical protein
MIMVMGYSLQNNIELIKSKRVDGQGMEHAWGR